MNDIIIIITLANRCKNIRLNSIFEKQYKEIIDLILNTECDEKDKISILVELYRFGYYSGVRTSLDPRADNGIKNSILTNIKISLEQNNIKQDLIESIKNNIDFMRENIDNPIRFIKQEIEFYSKNPNVKF